MYLVVRVVNLFKICLGKKNGFLINKLIILLFEYVLFN